MQHILLFSMRWEISIFPDFNWLNKRNHASLPAYAALLQPQALTSSDYLLAFLSLSTVLVQFVADNQQWSYHQFKQSGEPDKDAWPGANLALKEADRKRGFVANGLWRFSRHPNFLCEQVFANSSILIVSCLNWQGFSAILDMERLISNPRRQCIEKANCSQTLP